MQTPAPTPATPWLSRLTAPVVVWRAVPALLALPSMILVLSRLFFFSIFF